MGLIRFLVPQRDRILPEAIPRAYIVGMDEVPWSSRIVASDDGLIVDRPVGESGCFHIPWPVKGYGETVLCTASLMERDSPYLLELELARGTLNRIRNQMSNWELAGMVVPEPISKRLSAATEKFSRAATSQGNPTESAELAAEVLSESLGITVSIGTTYAQQALAARHATGTRLITMLGANLGGAPLDDSLARNFLSVFNSAIVPMSWRRVETDEGQHDWALTDSQLDWCATHSLKTCSGPLVHFDGTDLPDWLYLWEEDTENVMGFVSQYVRAVVNRYRGRINVWQAAARISSGSFLGFAQQHKMRMVVRVVEIVRDLDPQTPVILTFDQLWGEFISRQESELPVYLADTLVRSNLGLAGIGLEINLAYHPGGTYRRDVIEFSRQLDRWSMLGLPMMVSLVVPGGAGKDDKARATAAPLQDEWSGERQEEWVRQFVPVILGKQSVQGVMWNQYSDTHEHAFPHGGLIDADAKPKPALNSLSAIRKAHLS